MDQQSDENVVVTETESAPEEKASAPESEKKPKRAIPKPLLIGAIAAVCVVVLLVIIIASAGAYKTPLRTMQKYENAETVACEKLTSDMLNGIDGGYLTKAVKLLKKSKIDTKIEKIEKNYEDAMSEARDDYGANYRISFRSIDSLELEKEDLWNYRNNIRSLGKTLYTSGKAIADMKNSELKDEAEELGLTVEEVQKLGGYLMKAGEKLSTVKVTKGYRLDVLGKITGSKLDSPEKGCNEVIVLNVGGKWIAYGGYSEISAIVKALGL